MHKNFPFSDCAMPETVNATIDAVPEVIDTVDFILHGDTANIECDNFTLFALNVDGTNQFAAATVACDEQVWDIDTSAWTCVPTCEYYMI